MVADSNAVWSACCDYIARLNGDATRYRLNQFRDGENQVGCGAILTLFTIDMSLYSNFS